MEPFNLNADGTPPAPRPRPSWVRDRIARYDRRLEPRSRKLKWDAMSRSPFAFFRGTNHLFWDDFARSSFLDEFSGGKKTRLWVCGDAQCGHFGSFTDSSGRLVYDLDDFSETVVADYQMDLLRLASSLVLAGRENKRSPRTIQKMAVECGLGYWREIKACRWYKNVRYTPWDEEAASGSMRHFLSHTRKHRGFDQMLERFTRADKKGLRFKTGTGLELEALPAATAKKLGKLFQDYAKDLKPWPAGKPRVFEVLDLARRLRVGISSEGLERYYALVRVVEEGSDPYRILEAKQQVKPGAWDELPKKAKRKTYELSGDSQALRVEMGTRALARNPDPWLGRLEFQGKEFTVGERPAIKSTLPGEMLDEVAAGQLGAILARAHCRAKEAFGENAYEVIKPERKAFRKGLAVIAQAYADQAEMDFQSFLATRPD